MRTTQKQDAVSTFVKLKEKTEEGVSLIYIFGILFCALPYCFYLVFKIRNNSFDILKDDPRVNIYYMFN